MLDAICPAQLRSALNHNPFNERRMIVYPDGTEARVGDNVSLSHGTDRGIVCHILDSVDLAKAWNLKEVGLMIDSVVSGLTFYPLHSLDRDQIKFLSRVVA